MPKGRLREVNNYLLHSLMNIITFSERTVGVVTNQGKEDKIIDKSRENFVPVFFTVFTYAIPDISNRKSREIFLK